MVLKIKTTALHSVGHFKIIFLFFFYSLFSVMSLEGIGEGVEREDCVQALSGQIFMGMVSSQFQARLDTVRLIDALVTACIRFVYFSMEDELRSKVNGSKGVNTI